MPAAQANVDLELANDPTWQPSGDDLYRLGLAHSTGQGVELDYVEAHKWFNLAAVNGCDAAKVYRKELADQMTRQQVSAAQRAARQWLSDRAKAQKEADQTHSAAA